MAISPPSLAEGTADSLPPIAAKLCATARRILSERGFAALSLSSVAGEAGEYKASIAYYFGKKSGLLSAVADSVFPRETCLALIAAVSSYPAGESRIAAQMSILESMAADRDSIRAYFELLPHAFRDKVLRAKLASLYDWYRQVGADMLGVESPDSDKLKYIGATINAAVDGFALQALVDPDNFELDKAFDALGSLLTAYLRSEYPGDFPDKPTAEPGEDA